MKRLLTEKLNGIGSINNIYSLDNDGGLEKVL